MLKHNLYKIITAICVLMLLAATIFVFVSWPQVPDKIPMHYNFAGEADGFGGKTSLIILTVVAWLTFLIVSVSTKNPEKWNMPVEVTEENKSRLFAITRAMMEALKLLTTILFVLMLTTAAAGVATPQWAMIVIIAAIILVVAIGFVLMYKNK